MLQYETAKRLYEEMKEKAKQSPLGGFQDFYKMFLKSAVDYAATRAAWATMDQAARNEDDKPRRLKHDAFISMLNAISRNLGISMLSLSKSGMPRRISLGIWTSDMHKGECN